MDDGDTEVGACGVEGVSAEVSEVMVSWGLTIMDLSFAGTFQGGHLCSFGWWGLCVVLVGLGFEGLLVSSSWLALRIDKTGMVKR